MYYLPAENIKILYCTLDTATLIVNIQIQFKIFRLLFTAYCIIITTGGARLNLIQVVKHSAALCRPGCRSVSLKSLLNVFI